MQCYHQNEIAFTEVCHPLSVFHKYYLKWFTCKIFTGINKGVLHVYWARCVLHVCAHLTFNLLIFSMLACLIDSFSGVAEDQESIIPLGVFHHFFTELFQGSSSSRLCGLCLQRVTLGQTDKLVESDSFVFH